MKFGYNWPSGFRGQVVNGSEEKLFEIVDRRQRQRMETNDDPCLYCELCGAFGSGELKI